MCNKKFCIWLKSIFTIVSKTFGHRFIFSTSICVDRGHLTVQWPVQPSQDICCCWQGPVDRNRAHLCRLTPPALGDEVTGEHVFMKHLLLKSCELRATRGLQKRFTAWPLMAHMGGLLVQMVVWAPGAFFWVDLWIFTHSTPTPPIHQSVCAGTGQLAWKRHPHIPSAATQSQQASCWRDCAQSGLGAIKTARDGKENWTSLFL